MQRIEAFKNSMPRDELLRLGDEVVSEMQPTIEGQFMLTEVMMADQMDRLIIKRLRLRTYAKWRQGIRWRASSPGSNPATRRWCSAPARSRPPTSSPRTT